MAVDAPRCVAAASSTDSDSATNDAQLARVDAFSGRPGTGTAASRYSGHAGLEASGGDRAARPPGPRRALRCGRRVERFERRCVFRAIRTGRPAMTRRKRRGISDYVAASISRGWRRRAKQDARVGQQRAGEGERAGAGRQDRQGQALLRHDDRVIALRQVSIEPLRSAASAAEVSVLGRVNGPHVGDVAARSENRKQSSITRPISARTESVVTLRRSCPPDAHRHGQRR